jgi:short-subunit dehydrogenase
MPAMDDLRGLRALVTGASSGIGAAIARELHAGGVTVVVTARREAQLQELAADCGNAEVIVGDLGRPGGARAVWAAATAKAPIDIVVNNAGFGYLKQFTEQEWARDAEMIQLNMASLVELCRLFVDQKRPRGYVLNIASIGAYQAVPNMALYAASKAFVRDFTEALHDELAGGPLSATVVCPGGTHTEFHAVAGAGNYGWLARSSMKSAEEVARYSVRALVKKKRIAIPGILNKLSCWSTRLAPRWLASFVARRIMGREKT